MPSVPTEAISEIAKNTMTTFMPFYVKGYATALVKQLKREAAAVPSPFQLSNYELPSEPIKMGMLTKQGIIKKSWKHRFFVIYNAKDNFMVHYYIDQAAFEAHPDKPKGKISMCNIKVKKMKKEEEVKEFGEHAMTFKPDGRRRQWYVRAADAETLKAWKSAFKYAARYAKPALHKDKCMRAAFKLAYRETRWALWVWSWYRYDQSEAEMLGQLVVDKCEQELMGDVYAKIPSGVMYWKVRGMVEKTLDQTVGAVVGGMWRPCEAGVESARETLKVTAKNALGDIIAKEVELKATLRASLATLLEPHTAKIGGVVSPAVQALAKPLYKAYRMAVKIFATEMTKAAQGSTFDRDVAHFSSEVRWYYGVMLNAFVKVRALTRPESCDAAVVRKMGISVSVPDVLAAFGEVSLWRIEDLFEGNLRELMYKAIWTLQIDVKAGVAPLAAVHATLRKMLHDARVQATKDVHFLFFDVIHGGINKLVREPVAALVTPLQSLIPSPLEALINPRDIADEVLRGVISDTISAVIEPGCEEQFGKLSKLTRKLAL